MTADARLRFEEIAQVSHKNLDYLLQLRVSREEVKAMIRVLGCYYYNDRDEVAKALSLLDKIAKALGGRASPYYGRTLLRLSLVAENLDLVQRLSLFFKSLSLILRSNDKKCVGPFLREWVLSGRLLEGFFFWRREIRRTRRKALGFFDI
jgi:hypothetical protein